MQRWEYMHLRVTVDSAGREKVVGMNGQDLDKVTSSLLGMNVNSKGEDVHDFLNRVGKDGWELVSYTTSVADAAYTAILKRPLA